MTQFYTAYQKTQSFNLNNRLLAIFDLDGTLLDTTSSICETMIETLVELELPQLDRSYIEGTIGLPIETILSPLKLTDSGRVEAINVFREKLHLKIRKGVKIFPRADEFIKLLENKQILLSIATSKPTFLAIESVKNSSLSNFNFKILGSDGLKPKPNPEIIFRILAEHDPTFSAVMFGDREEDIKAARSAGIKSVGISQTSHNKQQLLNAGASFVFKDFTEAIENFEEVYGLFLPKHHVP